MASRLIVQSLGDFRDDPLARHDAASIDHLICLGEQHGRNIEAERLGGLEVDHHFELDWGLDGKLARLRALEDAIGIGRRAPKTIGQVNSVGQQPADSSEETVRIDDRKTIASR